MPDRELTAFLALAVRHAVSDGPSVGEDAWR
jgi:hypothetical protein